MVGHNKKNKFQSSQIDSKKKKKKADRCKKQAHWP